MTFHDGYRVVRGTTLGRVMYVVKRGESLIDCTASREQALTSAKVLS